MPETLKIPPIPTLLDLYIDAYAALRRYELTPDEGPEGETWQKAYRAIHRLHRYSQNEKTRRFNRDTLIAASEFLHENRIWLDLLPNGRFEAHEVDD